GAQVGQGDGVGVGRRVVGGVRVAADAVGRGDGGGVGERAVGAGGDGAGGGVGDAAADRHADRVVDVAVASERVAGGAAEGDAGVADVGELDREQVLHRGADDRQGPVVGGDDA